MSRIKKIINEVSKEMNVPVERIYGLGKIGTQKDMIVTAARWKIIHQLREGKKPLSYPQIGKILNIDHSTVIYAAKKMKATEGRYFDERIKKLSPQSIKITKDRNRCVVLAKLKKEFEKGLIMQVIL
jgi:chromosomal replication initiation ATPase DnaA